MTDPKNLPEVIEPDQTSVHRALAEAAAASKPKEATKVYSVRIPESIKDAAQHICELHGTDLATFLRFCAIGLIQDYGFDAPAEE